MKINYRNKYSQVADLYDLYTNTDFDINFWIKECSKDKEVLELACGTGRITIRLAKAGIKVTAIDISREFIKKLKAKCKKEKLGINIHEADMRSFSLKKKFPLIIIPFQSIQELVDPKDHEATFTHVYNHLDDKGRFIVTTHNTDIVDKKALGVIKLITEFVNPRTKNKMKFLMSRSFNPKTHIGTAHQVYEEYDKNNRLISKKLFKNSHYVFEDREIEALAKKTGFNVRKIYGDYSHSKLTKKSQFRIYEIVKKI